MSKIKLYAMLPFMCAAFVFTPMTAYAGGESKEVCETKVDPKTKKEKQVCKTIKVHKKLEGTKVPEKK